MLKIVWSLTTAVLDSAGIEDCFIYVGYQDAKILARAVGHIQSFCTTLRALPMLLMKHFLKSLYDD